MKKGDLVKLNRSKDVVLNGGNGHIEVRRGEIGLIIKVNQEYSDTLFFVYIQGCSNKKAWFTEPELSLLEKE